MTQARQSITVLGDGAWGTAVASLLVENNHEVTIWCHDPAKVCHVEQTLPPALPTTNLQKALQNKIIFQAIPVQFLRTIIAECSTHMIAHSTSSKTWVSLSKGIEETTLKLSTEIITEYFPQASIAALSGPSFACDLIKKQPTGVTIATKKKETYKDIKQLVENQYFCSNYSQDIQGTELCGAFKNIFALGTGLLAGAGYGDNSQVLLIIKGFEEIKQLIKACGGEPATLYSLAGTGDLMLTCLSKKSKNFQVGYALGQGQPLAEYLTKTNSIPEGLNTLKSIQQLSSNYSIKLPLCSIIEQVINSKTTALSFAQSLCKD